MFLRLKESNNFGTIFDNNKEKKIKNHGKKQTIN